MTGRTQFPNLFASGQISGMTLKNRLVMTAMGGISGANVNDDGTTTKQTEEYFEARAKGGVGLIIVGSCPIDWLLGMHDKPRLGIHDDKCIPGLSRIAEVIHKHGAKAAVQLLHAGPNLKPSGTKNLQPVSASAIVRPAGQLHELSVKEIENWNACFVKAAQRAQKAGFDGIEILAGHDYLINSFLSPFWNRREDKYGGDLRNRAQFLLEIISAIKESVGHDYPLWCKINAKETDVEGGTTLEMTKELALMLQNAGAHAISVSMNPAMTASNPPGYIVDLAAEVKTVVSVPVITVGRINPWLGEKLLRQKKADFIAMGRALLADPELPNKLASTRLDDIAPCLYCNTCNKRIPSVPGRGNRTRECSVNTALARETDYAIQPAEKSKKVLVVGGGPAGMEAARVAALRGHKIVLYEKDHRLGGELMLASVLREENEALVKYLSTQLEKLGVKVELGKEVSSAIVAEIKPDAIVLAIGAAAVPPEIPGINRKNVLSATDIQQMMKGRLRRSDGKQTVGLRRVLWYLGCNIMRAPFGPSLTRLLLGLWTPFGKNVIVVGRRLPGIELAHFLVERGTEVTIVDTHGSLPVGEPPMPALREFLEDKLVEKKIPILTVAQYKEVTDKGLTVIDKEGQRQTIKGDTIIFTGDYRPNTGLFRELVKTSREVHLIGDCALPRGILEAIDDGSRIGRAI